jgi:hypothetical protein
VFTAGCSLLVNPFTDELAGQGPVTTPSADVVRAAPVETAITQRPYAEVQVNAHDGTVTHGPLYFEDPFEDTGSEDGRFAWTGTDYLHAWLLGPGRFAVNAVAFPISAVVDPPWVVMASDGQPSRSVAGMKHDAERQR